MARRKAAPRPVTERRLTFFCLLVPHKFIFPALKHLPFSFYHQGINGFINIFTLYSILNTTIPVAAFLEVVQLAVLSLVPAVVSSL